jgi:hypothetical protein
MAELAVITDAFERWAQGDQAGAVEVVRPGADADDPASLALICWFLVQRGEPHWREGVPYAERALKAGYGFAVNHYWNNMFNDPGLRSRLPEFVQLGLHAGNFGFDPIAQAYSVWNQDRPTATRLVEIISGPPSGSEGWPDFLERTRRDYDALQVASSSVTTLQSAAVEAIDAAVHDVESRRTDLETRTRQLLTLIEQTTNAQAQTFFDAEAKRYETEGRFLWRWSVGLLTAAAVFAVAPLVIYYVGSATGRHWLVHQNLTTAHFAPAIALGTIAGLLLARARGRDRSRQRAQDLSVALGTMFVYSGQIADENERQAFLRDMGRTVIEAHLRQDAPSDRESSGLLAALTRR